jgi:hypothetical protein
MKIAFYGRFVTNSPQTIEMAIKMTASTLANYANKWKNRIYRQNW